MTTEICQHIYEDGSKCTPDKSAMHLTATLMAELPSAHHPHPMGADCKCINGAWSCLKCHQWSLNTENQCRQCRAFRTALLETEYYSERIIEAEIIIANASNQGNLTLSTATAELPLLKRIVELLKEN